MKADEESQVKEQASEMSQEAARQRKIKVAYRRVFLGKSSAADGQLVLTDILQSCGVLRQSIVFGDSEQTIFNEGVRSVGVALLDMLDKRGFAGILELEKRGAELTRLGEER